MALLTRTVAQDISSVTSDVLFCILETCARNPLNPALSQGDETWTCDDLVQRMSTIAETLIQASIGRGAVVGVLQPHGFDLVASLLAILHVGAAYLPLDQRLPEERLAFLLTDSGATAILGTSALLSRLPGDTTASAIAVDEITPSGNLAIAHGALVEEDDPAYVIYTSGSTGQPKGVVVSRANLANYCHWAAEAYAPRGPERFALYSPLSFDFTATCIFPPLLRGGTIEIYDGINDPFVIRTILSDNRVDVLKITPAYLEVFAELVTATSRISRIIVGGEDFTSDLAAKVHSRMGGKVQLINEYGPTEATVGCMHHVYDPLRDQDGSVSIGRPIDNMDILLLDDTLQPVPPGASGEIFIAGPSVASGYLNRPELTQRAFCSLPFRPGERIYRTGDYARPRDNGDLVFIGRKDDQVKIRGHRVELGEVESTLKSLDGVASAHVTSIEYRATRDLLAAVVTRVPMTAEQIRSALGARLPAHMVPSHVLMVDALPLTANQKIDRTALLNAWEAQTKCPR